MGNSATEWGGGIFCDGAGALPTIMNNTIMGNTANDGGGIGGIQTYIVTNNFIAGNTAYKTGGGISCWAGSKTISNNTITENKAYLEGGGIYC